MTSDPPFPVEVQSTAAPTPRRASNAARPKVEDPDQPKPRYAKQKKYRAQKARLTQELREELQEFGSLTKARDAKAPELMDAAAKTLRFGVQTSHRVEVRRYPDAGDP